MIGLGKDENNAKFYEETSEQSSLGLVLSFVVMLVSDACLFTYLFI